MSHLSAEVELLRRVPLFAAIEPSKLKLLAYTSESVTYRAGQVIFHMGDTGDAAYVLINGEAEVSVETDTGEIPVAQLKDGDFVGEIAILCDVPRTATVKAKTELKALRISKEPFLQLMRQFPDIAIEMTRSLADRLTRTTAELVEAQKRMAAQAPHG